MVHKPDNGDSTQHSVLTHRVQRVESADIPNRDVDYELVREENPLESVRVPNRLVGGSSGGYMTEFSRRFEEVVDNISKISVDMAKTVTSVSALDKRINGSFEAINKHICEGIIWHKAILSIIVMVIIQIVSIAYLFGILSEKVGRNTGILEQHLRDYKEINENINMLRGEVKGIKN